MLIMTPVLPEATRAFIERLSPACQSKQTEAVEEEVAKVQMHLGIVFHLLEHHRLLLSTNR